MPTHGPQQPPYALPDSRTLSTAAQSALGDLYVAQQHVARVMGVVIAAAVRDILTGCDPEAPFDAAWLELAEVPGELLHPTGAYWTSAGERRTFVGELGEADGGAGVHELTGWTWYLDDTNREVWEEISERLGERDGCPLYRMDLVKAAALPLT